MKKRGGGWKRNYTAPTDRRRCQQDIVLRDGSGAQCMRGAVKGGLCCQHSRMAPKGTK